MSASGDVSTALSSTNMLNYDYVDLSLKISNTGSVSSLSNYLNVYRRDLVVDGTNNEPTPSTVTSIAWSQHLVAVASIPPFTVASTCYQLLKDIPVSQGCEFYIENKLNTGVGAGWVMTVRPKTDSFA